ncbi:translation initiation factor [Waterburya agarophytonicola K14]|uniref:Translation initiation factor n=1 Tax=Waterburya agarophytonicola KI4 TaxID=2874699 RepID=A0A964FE46_9CYAN|nr:translation initiation factor [Waterburya agarophytonicola]MCC0175721.1 translation initiation factor [Waterburya agarophytonicola KI4]
MAGKGKSSAKRIAYQEFGSPDNSSALERGVPDLPPDRQDLRIQTTRSGRKGKTVTIITGFQHKPETLSKLLKQLKAKCGAGGTVKDNSLELQGDRKQQLLEIVTKLGYKAKISGG